jgi:UDP-N-acetylmuramyl tripeptide synthase
MHVAEKLLLIGPNRRSEQTIIEHQLVPEEQELSALAARFPEILLSVSEALPGLDAESKALLPDAAGPPAEPLAALARLYTALGLVLQRLAGHRVREAGFEPDRAGKGVWAWFEYEHDGVGEQAAELALRLISAALACADSASARRAPLADIAAELSAFEAMAARHVLPRDTEAIVTAATRRDLPCFKLERDPYPGLSGEFRIRMNGLLMIGHGRHKRIVDGTFCVTRCARLQPIVRDRQALRRLLESWGVPLPRRAPDAGNCALTRRALRAAEAIGYPVVVKPGARARRAGVSLALASPAALRSAVDAARAVSPAVTVEAMVAGASHRLLVAGGEPVALLSAGRELEPDRAHSTTLALARQIARRLDVGIAAFDLVTTDIRAPLDQTGGALVDLDLAPELDALLSPDSRLYAVIAEAFLGWIFPPGSAARIPIISVTGTNGKTTTCRMISRILQQSGRRTGMVCSEGIYINERYETSRAETGVGAHHRVLERPDVEAAVFEEYFGRIARLGFAYRWCDVAVCTNVTNDHLGRIGIHTLEQMADLKRAVPERARAAVVLNADDASCLDMAKQCGAERICLVSTRDSPASRTRALGARGARCVVESDGGRDWAVIHDGDRRIPLIPIADIPATFGGTAEFNVSNALHAAAACHFAGVGATDIASGLRSFEMSFESTPGRLNRYQGLPFQVIIDYAHNADGFRQLCAFVDLQPVPGKKIVMFGFTGDRKDPDILAAAAQLAGHFDQYVCRNFRIIRQREPHEVPELLRRGLRAAGVGEESIHVVPEAERAVNHALGLAGEGDLVVLLVGTTEFQSVWQMLPAWGKVPVQAN